MANPVCVVCASPSVEQLSSAVGDRAYCRQCFHGWRTSIKPFSYAATAMCSLGTSEARIRAQIAFFAPFCAPFARILEIGCATGELAGMVRAIQAPSRYEAIELSPAGQEAVAHLDVLYNKPLTTLIEEGAIEPGFDLILMSHVLEHIEDITRELEAMASMLTPTGSIFIEVPNLGGHRKLPIDDNRSHLHFFSTTSLVRLLANHGLEVVATCTDAWLDARYADSIRVVARRFERPHWSATLLSDHPLLADEASIVVWGAGSLTDEMLANFFDLSKIDFFIDRDPAKQGTTILGRPVRAPEDLGNEPQTVLLNSIDFAPAIAADLKARYPGVAHRLVPIADLLD